MKAKLTILTVCAGMLLGSEVSAGEKYVGRWDGQARSTIEIIQSAPLTVRYCFRNNPCSMLTPRGSLENIIVEWPRNGDFAGADMVLKKVGETYQGTYRVKGSSQYSTIIMKRR